MATIHRATTDGDSTASHDRGDDRLLVLAAAFFAVAVLVHGADHLRRGVDAIDRDVFWLGTTAIALQIALVVLACQRHRLAPLAALAGGFSLALGYVVVHFLPGRPWFSDSFTSAGADVSILSWVAASLEVVAAASLGVAGLVVLRRRGGLASATRPNRPQRSLRSGVLHPLALVMIVGNLAILAISLTQL